MAQRLEGDSIGRKSVLVWFKLVSLPGIVHQSLALFVSVLLLSESVAATPGQMGVNIAQQPAARSQEASRAAAQQAFQEGVQLYQQETAESRRQAIEKWEEALSLFRAVGDKAGEARTLLGIGVVYSHLGENQKALEFFNQSLPLWHTVGDKAQEATTLNNIGVVYSHLGEKQKALEYYNQSVPLSRAVGDKAAEADSLSNIGDVYSALGETQKALEYYNQSVPLSRAVGDKAGEANTLNSIGAIYSALGEKQKGLEYYNQSLSIRHAVGDKTGEATTLNNIGVVYSQLGEKQKAVEYYNQSLLIRHAVGDKAGEANSLNNIGNVYSALGEKQKALEYYNQSLLLSRAVGDKLGEAFILDNIGNVYSDLGEKQKALEFFNQSLPLRRAVGDKAGEAVTLNNISAVYSALGEKQKALDFYNQSLPLTRAVGDKAGEATILSNIGGVYSALGEEQKALDFYNQSLPLTQAVGDKAGEAATLTNIGTVYYSLGEKQKALELFNQSLPLRRAVGDKAGEATTLNYIGNVYLALGEEQKALDFYNQSLPLTRAVGDRSEEAAILNNISGVYLALGEKQKALGYLNQSLPLTRAVGEKEGEASVLKNIAFIERDRGNFKVALTQIEAAINIIESLRTKIASQQLRASYFASKQDYYEFYIDLLMQLHKTNPDKGYDALALQTSERALARTLLEILTEARADIRSGVDTELVGRERSLQQQLNAAEQSRVKLLQGQYTNKQLDDIKQQIESLLTQLEQVQAEIREKSPRYAALTQPQPLNLQQIQQQVLDDNTLLLEYSLGEDRSYLWAVTKTGITSYELPKRADIEAEAQKFKELLKSTEMGSPEVGMKLSQMLLAPVANQLGQKRLLIVSDGALQSIPFAALPIPMSTSPLKAEGSNAPPSLVPNETGGLSFTSLLVDHEIVSLPSASTIAVLRNELKGRSPAAKTVAVLADPVFTRNDERLQASQLQQSNATTIPTELKRSATDVGVILNRLKYSRTEAEQILALVSAASERQQALDFAASRATATSPNLAQYRLIHFATHGLLDNIHPELSGVVLSLFDEKGTETDGFLRLHDIYNLNLPAELVVLSACETGLGKDVKGEGLVGLTRGFMYAGAKRVVVSLWSVNDAATAKLMEKFYQQMLQKGVNPVAALRAAQLEMWKTEQWKAPYYWAAFVVQGEWR